MVPELLRRHRVAAGAVGALGAAEVAVVIAVAATHATDGALSIVIALGLAPAAVAATALSAGRIGGERLAVAAAAVYVVLPFLGNRYMLGVYRSTYDERAVPALLGLRESLVFAVGVACAAIVAFAPRFVAAAGGLLALVVAAAAWQLGGNTLVPGLHETVWSITLLRWLVLAGIIAVLLRSFLLAAAVGGWLLAATIWAAHRGYDDAVFWRSLAVATPAAAVLLSSLVLLVPRLRPARSRAPAPNGR